MTVYKGDCVGYCC